MPGPQPTPVHGLSRLVSALLSPEWQSGLVLTALVAVVAAGAARSGGTGIGPIGEGTRLFAAGPDSVDPSHLLPVSARTIATSSAKCELTPAQEIDAVAKFDRIWPVLRHPRCMNCHGGVNPFVDESRGKHLGGKIARGRTPEEKIENCQECHSGLPGWEIPLDIFFFYGKSSRQLCNLFKKSQRSGELFVNHIANDNGLVQFTATAFKGDRALDEGAKAISEAKTGRPFQNDPPPIPHDKMIELTRDWTDVVGQGWLVPDCGCKLHGSTWTGTITGEWDLHMPDLGYVRETTRANVRYIIDSSLTDESATRWKTTSGLIEWSSNISGTKCTASASGTVPVGLGSDLNPMGGITQEQAPDPRVSRFTVSIGPWPEQYDPHFTIKCQGAPPLPGVLFGGGIWWEHPQEGMLSPDGLTLAGTYEAPSPWGTMKWTWDLQLDKDDDAGDGN
jgi:hypothetical protein